MEHLLLNTKGFVRFIYTTDWHTSATPPGRRTGSYQEDILAKIKFCGNLAHERQAVKLCGGDVFHIKDRRSPSNDFSLVNPLITACGAMPYGCVWGAHGNHDLFADRTDSLPTQPMGALIASKRYRDLSVEPTIFFSTDEDDSVSVAVEAYPYADDLVTLEKVLAHGPRPKVAGKPVDFRVAILHQYGHPGNQGAMFKHPTIGYNQLADTDYDLILWGHDHSREEVVKVGKPTHVRFGSLSRAAISSDEVDRPVSAAELTFTKKGFEVREVEIPVKPLHIAFVTADRATTKLSDSIEVTEFLDTMDSTISEVESKDPLDVVRELCGDDIKTYEKITDLCGA
jgi:DNA repair exonuclease SbcCD nuclease subunit